MCVNGRLRQTASADDAATLAFSCATASERRRLPLMDSGGSSSLRSEPKQPAKRQWFLAKLDQLRQRCELLAGEHATAGRLGFAVGAGVLIGCTPFLGFQVLLALALATLLRLNRIAVLLGLQISVPPITPFLLFANAQVGALLLHGHWLALSLDVVRNTPTTTWVWDLFLELLAGGLLIGGPLALAIGSSTACLVQRHRVRNRLSQHVSPTQLERLATQLRKLPARWRTYARWKLRLDPVYLLVLDELPREVDLVDLGAGIGLLSYLVVASRPAARIDAVEWDPRKTEAARRLLGEFASVNIHQGDARQYALGRPGAVTLIDVLHYSSLMEQREWVSRCAGALRPGGLLIIRELDATRSKRPWSVWLERVAVHLSWNRGAAVELWSPVEIANDLTGFGFTVVVRRAGAGIFRGNALLIARKPSE